MRTRAVNCSRDFKEKRSHLIFYTSSLPTSLLLIAPTRPKYSSNYLQPREELLFLKNPAASAYRGLLKTYSSYPISKQKNKQKKRNVL